VGISGNYSNPSFGGPLNNAELIVARQPETDLKENSEKKKRGGGLETYNLRGRLGGITLHIHFAQFILPIFLGLPFHRGKAIFNRV
jgi:hypothetical protein